MRRDPRTGQNREIGALCRRRSAAAWRAMGVATRDRIAAAIERIEADGRVATGPEIARATGINERTVYHHVTEMRRSAKPRQSDAATVAQRAKAERDRHLARLGCRPDPRPDPR